MKRLYVLTLLLFLWLCSGAQRVGLVLSGGGSRGMAHIGALKALEENQIPIDYIAGTSAGAIVGSLYAMGLSPETIDSIARTEEFYSWATGRLDPDYLYYYSRRDENASWITLKLSLDSTFQSSLATNLVSSIPYDYRLMESTAGIMAKAGYNFDSLFVPFRCVASDIENKKSVIFRDGDLGRAVRASSAYPFYFRPISIDNKILYDGGMYNNFPADVLLSEFQPDIILGVNTSGKITPTSETNLISQIRSMMTTPTNFSVICENGILIDVNTDEFGLFDFEDIGEIIQRGYESTMAMMDSIKLAVQRRQNPVSLIRRRREFRSGIPEVKIDKLLLEGITPKQEQYVKNVVKPGIEPVPLSRIKSSYFRLATDQNVRSIDPQLIYNDSTGLFDLKMKINRERELITQFGGNISSRPISEAYAGLTYLVWSKRAYSFSGNFYFGRLYTSGQARIRMDSPTKTPHYIELDATLNQYDFFRSSNSFFTDEKPAYILQSDYNFGINGGIPVRNKGKFYGSAAYVRIRDNYYQTQNFATADTADKTTLKGFSGAITFERNTLNKKLFANEGTYLRLRFRLNNFKEITQPGSTSVIRTEETDYHTWYQVRANYENYFFSKNRFKLGVSAEAVISNIPFFNNYTATVVNTTAYEPVLEMQTLYLPEFHAPSFGGGGLKGVLSIRSNLDLRAEGYVFQPYQELLKTSEKLTELGEPFARRYYVASGGAVFHSPIGPISLFVNYYNERQNPVSVLFTAGFLIFNASALD